MKRMEHMQNNPSVSVCFPVYNEEGTILSVIENANLLLQKEFVDWEIVVCNDGSTDRTGEILESLSGIIPNLRILTHPANKGIAATFQELYQSCTKDYIFLNATDGQWPNEILLELVRHVPSSDAVVSVRREKHYGFLRSFVSFSFNALPWMLFGVRVRDAGSVKLIRRELIDRYPIISRSPFAEAELLMRIIKGGGLVTFVPVTIRPRLSGRSSAVSWNAIVGSIMDMIRVFRDMYFRKAERKAPASDCQPHTRSDRQ